MVHTRRQRRGYNFETELVKEFSKGDWRARRLGGASSGLPDVGIINNKQKLMYAVEAKSTVYNNLEIPYKQIKRCLDYLDLFELYKRRQVIFAFRFATKRAILAENTKVKITRVKPVYYFYIVKKFHKLNEIESVTCNSKGRMNVKIKNYNPDIDYSFKDFIDLDRVTSISELKHYGWDTDIQSNFDHLFTI